MASMSEPDAAGAVWALTLDAGAKAMMIAAPAAAATSTLPAPRSGGDLGTRFDNHLFMNDFRGVASNSGDSCRGDSLSWAQLEQDWIIRILTTRMSWRVNLHQHQIRILSGASRPRR
jgi:hypothetical protein